MLGGVGYTPAFLLSQIKELKEELTDPNAPFGIDLLIPRTCFTYRVGRRGSLIVTAPEVGGSARKTNKDCEPAYYVVARRITGFKTAH